LQPRRPSSKLVGVVASAPGHWTDLEAQVRASLDRGDRDEAVTRAIEHLEPDIRGYLGCRLGEDDAEDALSQFRENVWKDLPRFRWECSLRAWAYRLAHHAVTRILRRPHRRREEHLPSSAASWLAASLGPGRSLASGQHQGLALLRAELSEEEQTLLTLRIDRELEWEEIAVVVGATSAALRKRFERLTTRLEQMAREHGLID
jgi:RNA polymerase sigma-70 factor (ECF subfamily)